jgi:signal transduction histidine kinase
VNLQDLVILPGNSYNSQRDVITNAINDTLTSHGSLKKERNTSPIKLEYRPQNIFVQADKGRIIQVISNLLSNAVKFTQKGTISISLERKKMITIVITTML